jgi:hypothetical protein
MEKQYPVCPFCGYDKTAPHKGYFHCGNCGEDFNSMGTNVPIDDDDDDPLLDDEYLDGQSWTWPGSFTPKKKD